MDLSIHDSGLQKDVESFKNEISKEAERLIGEFFPRKCIELDNLLKEDFMKLESATNVKVEINLPVPDPVITVNHQKENCVGDEELPTAKKRKLTTVNEFTYQNEPGVGTKVFVFPNGLVPCNEKIIKIVNILKPEVRTLVEKCNTVRMWVTLLIPKIEDGNNFGVSIQEETLSELRQVENESASFLDQISKYFFTRGQIVAKVAKYPHIGDYRQFVDELDEKEFLSLRLIAAELRNHYSSMHDMIIKNIEKIKRPRNSNLDGMY